MSSGCKVLDVRSIFRFVQVVAAMLDAAGVQAEKESEGALTPDCSREGR